MDFGSHGTSVAQNDEWHFADEGENCAKIFLQPDEELGAERKVLFKKGGNKEKRGKKKIRNSTD